MIVADTGAILALIDSDDRHHAVVAALYERHGDRWVLPWAILPEVDHLLRRYVGRAAHAAWLKDLAEGLFPVEWGEPSDLVRAREICDRYADLDPGLVDATVVALAERLGAEAIVTLDERDFGAIQPAKPIRLLPRDG